MNSPTTFRIQVKMINDRQVDVEDDGTLTLADIRERARQKARSEFGDCDHVAIICIEAVGLLGKVPTV